MFMQETKNFHRGPPPSPLVLLYCTLNIENQAAQIEGGRFMEEKYYNRLRPLLC